jgi:DNA-binding MarR family transcriptional regulator
MSAPFHATILRLTTSPESYWTLTQLAVAIVLRDGQMVHHKVAERLSTSRAQITRAADKLVRAGYVERRPHPDDRRSVLLVLTDDGERWIGWVCAGAVA